MELVAINTTWMSLLLKLSETGPASILFESRVMEKQDDHTYCVLCGVSLLEMKHFPVDLSEQLDKSESVLHFCSLCFLRNDLIVKNGESRQEYIRRVIKCLAGIEKSKSATDHNETNQ